MPRASIAKITTAPGNEEKFRDAGEEDRHKNDADAKSETKAGTAIWAAPSRMASVTGCLGKMAVNVLDGDGCIIDEDATASARPPKGHNVDRLADGTQDRAKQIERGEIPMISVLFQSPRKSRIMMAVRRGDDPSRTTRKSRRSQIDWSASKEISLRQARSA
jgi:hypothetical protein